VADRFRGLRQRTRLRLKVVALSRAALDRVSGGTSREIMTRRTGWNSAVATPIKIAMSASTCTGGWNKRTTQNRMEESTASTPFITIAARRSSQPSASAPQKGPRNADGMMWPTAMMPVQRVE